MGTFTQVNVHFKRDVIVVAYRVVYFLYTTTEEEFFSFRTVLEEARSSEVVFLLNYSLLKFDFHLHLIVWKERVHPIDDISSEGRLTCTESIWV